MILVIGPPTATGKRKLISVLPGRPDWALREGGKWRAVAASEGAAVQHETGAFRRWIVAGRLPFEAVRPSGAKRWRSAGSKARWRGVPGGGQDAAGEAGEDGGGADMALQDGFGTEVFGVDGRSPGSLARDRPAAAMRRASGRRPAVCAGMTEGGLSEGGRGRGRGRPVPIATRPDGVGRQGDQVHGRLPDEGGGEGGRRRGIEAGPAARPARRGPARSRTTWSAMPMASVWSWVT